MKTKTKVNTVIKKIGATTVEVNGQKLSLSVYFIYFAIGEIIVYTVEKLAGLPTTIQWYDLVWLLFIMLMFGLNSYELFLILASDAQ